MELAAFLRLSMV